MYPVHLLAKQHWEFIKSSFLQGHLDHKRVVTFSSHFFFSCSSSLGIPDFPQRRQLYPLAITMFKSAIQVIIAFKTLLTLSCSASHEKRKSHHSPFFSTLEEVCTLRLDFESFNLLAGSTTVEDDPGFSCQDEFTVAGLGTGQTIPIICGANNGQHSKAQN